MLVPSHVLSIIPCKDIAGKPFTFQAPKSGLIRSLSTFHGSRLVGETA